MFKELDQYTPHQILDKLGLIVNKPIPDEKLIAKTIDNLPVVHRDKLKLQGCGDWARGRSSGGSAVFSGCNYVLKVALGEQMHDIKAFDEAKKIAQIADKFADVSPPTGFFITRIDGPNKPAKVVIYQSKNHGKPACDTSIKTLLSPEVSQQTVSIIDKMQKVLLKDNLLDGIGVHLNTSNVVKRFFIRLICGFPWLSDNIMIDKNNKVELVDNVPTPDTHRITNPLKKQVNLLRLTLSKKLLQLNSNNSPSITKP